MKRDVLFWIGVKNPDPLMNEKHGGFKYLDIGQQSWIWWCNKNNVEFVEYTLEDVGNQDVGKHKPTWQRWFDVFRVLRERDIDYGKICVIDGSTIIRWDTPNFFNLCPAGELTAFRSLENLNWIAQGIDGYKDAWKLNDVEFDLTKYVSCGFQIFDSTHKWFLEQLSDYYFTNNEEILDLQNNKVKRGTDQPVYNYLLQYFNKKVHSLPPQYMLTHLNRFDWFGHNWQTGDTTSFFIKYGFIWFYSGFPNRGDREALMQQTWDAIKHHYA